MTEYEVARFALRTFRFSRGTLGSIFKEYDWEGASAIAECRKTVRGGAVGRGEAGLADHPCEKAPGDDCECGLYGTLDFDHLYGQYRENASRAVAVIAAEGQTLIGTKGLRTEAARIVAYWCAHQGLPGRGMPPSPYQVFTEKAPEATFYPDLCEMLAAYHFPESEQADRIMHPPAQLPTTPFSQTGAGCGMPRTPGEMTLYFRDGRPWRR